MIQVYVREIAYDVSVWPEEDADCPNARHWKLTVERQRDGRYAVLEGPYPVDADGVVNYDHRAWEDERFMLPLADALAVARKRAPLVTINGLTATEALARHRGRHPQDG